MAKWLMHTYRPEKAANQPEELHLQLDSHWFIIPPDEPFEVESDYYAFHLLQIYGPVYGIVELPVTKTRTGVTFDPDEGLRFAQVAMRRSMEEAVNQYARVQMEDRVRNNLPTLPPSGLAAQAIRQLKINLQQRYGFTPLGWNREENGQAVMSDGMMQSVASHQTDLVTLKSENADLKSQMAKMQETLEALLSAATDTTTRKR